MANRGKNLYSSETLVKYFSDLKDIRTEKFPPVRGELPPLGEKTEVKWSVRVPERPDGNTDNLYFVLDGGSLIHRVVWPKQETFGVYTTYMSYIKRHYGDEVTVFLTDIPKAVLTQRLLNAKGEG
ncbi:hypothetical protein AVEN_106830-1 [Araneus ventricosus]|uniref:Uncharacterized protein n=1 Tax=Araneus ventricosus TaxID=182803 RepID=A0A4Y2NR87_ARAVE|nr:hypothetical protein AVEN_106830-1 [Araneus ventricosus]